VAIVRFEHRTLDVACALDKPDVAERLAAWRSLCEGSKMHAIRGGLRIWLRPCLLGAALELARREARCCSFLDLELAVEGGRLRLDVTSPVAAAEPIAAALFGSPAHAEARPPFRLATRRTGGR
jgi:hypothetical protein